MIRGSFLNSSKPKTELIKKNVEFLLKCLQNIFNTGTVISLVAIALVVLYQILARYALPKAPVWTEELSRYLFIYCIVLASGTVIIKGRHVRLELFQHRLSEKGKLIYNIFCHLLVGVFCVLLLQYALKYTMLGNRQTSPAMGLKMIWVFASTFIFFALVSLTCVLLTVKDFLSLMEKRRS